MQPYDQAAGVQSDTQTTFVHLAVHGVKRAGIGHDVLLVRTLASALCVCVGPAFSALVLLRMPLRRDTQAAVCVASGTTVCVAAMFAAGEAAGLEGSDYTGALLVLLLAAVAVHQGVVVALPITSLLPNGFDDGSWED